MPNNAEVIVALCKLLIENTPHREVEVAVAMAEFKSLVAERKQTTGVDVPVGTFALAYLAEMWGGYKAHVDAKRREQCQS